MSEKPNSETEPNRFNRRNVLKSIAATGVGGTVTTGVSSAQSQSDPEVHRTVSEMDDTKEYIKNAFSDEKVQALDTHLKSIGFESQPKQSSVLRIDGADKDSDLTFSRYYVLKLPYENGSNETVQLIWTDKSIKKVGIESPIVHRIKNDELKDGIRSQSTDTDNEIGVVTYTVDSGEVTSEESTIDSSLAKANTESISTMACECETTVYECEDIGISCYISLAVAYAGTYWSCGACASGVGWIACGKCAATVIGSGAGTVSCIENADCWDETMCIDPDDYSQKPCEICDNISHPAC